MAYLILSDVRVEIAGVPLSTPAWQCLNPLELRKPSMRRGQDRVIPGAAGVRAKRRRRDVSRRSLEISVGGEMKWDGTEHADPNEGLDANLSHLRSNLLPSDGLAINATLYLPDGSTVDGDVQVEQFDWEYFDTAALITLDLTIPGGELS